MDRRGDHESVIAGGRYGNRRQRASQPLAAARRERQWQTSVQSLPLESAGKPEQTEYQARFACGSFPERSACDRYGHKASHSSTVASSASVMVKSYLSLTSSCCVA